MIRWMLAPARVALVASGFCIGLCACGATDEQLRARAAFDMSCPQDEIRLIRLDDRTQGVSGCGQKATYVESCSRVDGYGGKHDCTWVLNTDSRKSKDRGGESE